MSPFKHAMSLITYKSPYILQKMGLKRNGQRGGRKVGGRGGEGGREGG